MPVAFGHRKVVVCGYVETVVIGCGAAMIAHQRLSHEREDVLLEPLHSGIGQVTCLLHNRRHILHET